MEIASKEEILKQIMKYTNNAMSNYAFLIDGEWGCGKTYFIKKYVIPKINVNGKKAIYVSLYGIENIKNLEEKIYMQILEEIFPENRVMSIVKKGGNFFWNLAETTKEVIENKLEIKLPEITRSNVVNILRSTKMLNDCVLILDDLERCNIQLNIILGYINNYVENRDCKCILVANQKEMSKMRLYNNIEQKLLVALNSKVIISDEEENTKKDNRNITIKELFDKSEEIFNESNEYKHIKEKVIGCTMYYRTDYDDIISNIVADINLSERTKVIIKECKNDILKKIEEYEHFNVRTLRSMILQFNEIVECINIKNEEYYQNAMKKMLIIYLEECIIYKKGIRIQIKNSTYNDFLFEYEHSFFKSMRNFIMYNTLDKKLLNKEFNIYIKTLIDKNDNPNDPLNVLYMSYIFLKDEDVEKNLELLKKKLREDKYSMEVYSKIIMILITLKNIGFSEDYLTDAIKSMKYNISNREICDNEFDDFGFYFRNSEDCIEYNKVVEPIIQEIEKQKPLYKLNYLIQGNEWGENLYDFCSKEKGMIASRKKFLALLDIQKVIDMLEKSESKDIIYFYKALEEVYSFSNLEELFSNDLENFNKLIDGVKEIHSRDRIKNMNLNDLLEKLKSISMNLNHGK